MKAGVAEDRHRFERAIGRRHQDSLGAHLISTSGPTWTFDEGRHPEEPQDTSEDSQQVQAWALFKS